MPPRLRHADLKRLLRDQNHERVRSVATLRNLLTGLRTHLDYLPAGEPIDDALARDIEG